jgi:hypothetical protein
MYDLLHGDYVTAAMLKEGYYDKSEMDALMAVNAQAIAALQAALGVGDGFSTVADRVEALEDALADVKDRVSDLETDLENLTGAVNEIKVKNVGNITSGDLNNFFASQPANTTYYGYVSSTSVSSIPETSTGFITCKTGSAANIVRQIYRPAASAIVYERIYNGTAWGAWTRTDAAYSSVASIQLDLGLFGQVVFRKSGRTVYCDIGYRPVLANNNAFLTDDSNLIPFAYRPDNYSAHMAIYSFASKAICGFLEIEYSGNVRYYGNNISDSNGGPAMVYGQASSWIAPE